MKKLENYDIIKKYASLASEKFCNYTLGVLYMWEPKSGYEYIEYNDTLILRFTNHKGEKVFLYPMGHDIEGALKLTYDISKPEGGAKIMAVSNETAIKLASLYPCMSLTESRDWAEYIYKADDLSEYKGKHYNGQRNFYNRFKKRCPDYTYNIITPSDIPRLKTFLDNLDISAPVDSLKADEKQKCYRMLDGMFDIGCVGGYIESNGDILAFCVGETVGDTFYDHIEKGDKSYDGVYQALVKETATTFCKGVKYINREEDCGDIGLRISKMQYRPIEIKAKNTVYIGTAFCNIQAPVTIETENLVIREFNTDDTLDYYALASDIELNKYWGYDYRDDIKGVPPQDYFINGVFELIKKHEEYPLCITLNDKLIGEVTMHNFALDNSVEIGIRLLKDYHGKGFGIKTLKAICNYLKSTVKVSYIKAKCYLENTPSKRNFEKLGFTKIGKDDTYYYFRLD